MPFQAALNADTIQRIQIKLQQIKYLQIHEMCEMF